MRVLTRLTRIAGNPWLRIGLLARVLAFCGYGLYLEWPQVTAGLGRLHLYSVIFSLAAAMAGGTCMMLAWRAVLADLGSPLPLRAAAKISFVSQLGKYVPGAVWAFAAQVELGRDAGVPRRRSVAAVRRVARALDRRRPRRRGRHAAADVARHGPALLVGAGGRAGDRRRPVPAGLRPRHGSRCSALAGRQPLERRPSWPDLARALAWTLLGWVLLGLQVWLLVADIDRRAAATCCSRQAAMRSPSRFRTLLVVFPGGIGAREVVLTAALVPVLPHGTAVAVALMTRVVTTASDLAWGGLA